MKVIFLKEVRGQGHSGEVKEVKDGYAQNFLIKKGFAVPLTDVSMKRLKQENQLKESKEAEEVAKCQQIKKDLEQKKLVFKVKTGEKDKVFGSVSSKQIGEELDKLGFKIDRKKIVLDEHLSTLGVHIVKINLHKGVILELKVQLVKE